jgi:hypothetical protein
MKCSRCLERRRLVKIDADTAHRGEWSFHGPYDLGDGDLARRAGQAEATCCAAARSDETSRGELPQNLLEESDRQGEAIADVAALTPRFAALRNREESQTSVFTGHGQAHFGPFSTLLIRLVNKARMERGFVRRPDSFVVTENFDGALQAARADYRSGA